MSSLPQVPPRFLNSSCVFDIAILADCVTALKLWDSLSSSFNPKWTTLISDLTAAQYPPVGHVNPYQADGKISVIMSLMYRTKEAFATWEYETNGAPGPEYTHNKATVYQLIDQYEVAMRAPGNNQHRPIII